MQRVLDFKHSKKRQPTEKPNILFLRPTFSIPLAVGIFLADVLLYFFLVLPRFQPTLVNQCDFFPLQHAFIGAMSGQERVGWKYEALALSDRAIVTWVSVG